MQRIHSYLSAVACSVAIVLAGCGGGSGPTVPSVHATATPTTPPPTVLPTPQSGSNTQSVALSSSSATQATLPTTGGIATTAIIPKLSAGSGSVAVTVATGSKATMSSIRQARAVHPMSMAGGPYLLQLDFVPSATVSLTAAPGFSLDLSQYVTGSGLTISQAAAYLQSQSIYVGVVDDAGNFNTVGPLSINATSTALTVTYNSPSVAVTLVANAHYTIGVHVGAIVAPTSAPVPTPTASASPTATASPTASPTPTPFASPTISLFQLANIYGGSAIAKGIAADVQGNVWFAETPGNINAGDGFISKISPAGTVTFDTYSPTNEPTHPSGIAFDPNGNLWTTEDCGGSDLDVFSSTGAYQQSYFINPPNASLCGGAWTQQLIAGTDGNLWFAEGAQKIGKITTGGSATEYALPDAGVTVGVTNGPNGEVWFAEQLSVPGNATAGGKLGKITSTGQVVTYPLNTGEVPGGITLGKDGNLWFSYGTQTAATGIGKMTPSGRETDYTPSTTGQWGGASTAIMTGPDGKIWFGGSGILATMDPTSGTTATYPMSTSGCVGASPLQLVSVPTTNSIWFTSAGCIGEVVLH